MKSGRFLLMCCLFSTPVLAQGDLELREGDLMIQDLDCGGFCDAIEKVTEGVYGLDFSHIGILKKDSAGEWAVIEAVSEGVKQTALDDFLSRSRDAGGRPKVVVGRLKEAYRHLIPIALHAASQYLGKPYDEVFDIGNDSYYCSELVYFVFKEANENVPLFELQPMTFVDPETGKTFGVWEDYYRDLGQPVPEGEPGLNPGGISLSEAIEIVHRYW